MKTTVALLLTALFVVPTASFAGNTTSNGSTGVASSVISTVGGTEGGDMPVGSCAPRTVNGVVFGC